MHTLARACNCSLTDLMHDQSGAMLRLLKPVPTSVHLAVDLVACSHLLLPWDALAYATQAAVAGKQLQLHVWPPACRKVPHHTAYSLVLRQADSIGLSTCAHVPMLSGFWIHCHSRLVSCGWSIDCYMSCAAIVSVLHSLAVAADALPIFRSIAIKVLLLRWGRQSGVALLQLHYACRAVHPATMQRYFKACLICCHRQAPPPDPQLSQGCWHALPAP